MRKYFNRSRYGSVTLLMLSPGLLGFFALFFYPMLITVVRSLRPEGQRTGWTLQNYVTFLSSPTSLKVIVLTFFLAISATLLSIAVSVPLALVLREKIRGHRLFRLTILIPISVPGLIGALGLLLLYGSRGWFNLSLLSFVPFVNQPVAVNYTVQGLVLFYLWHYFSYTAVTTLSTVEALDRNVEEAATVAGANNWHVLRYIIMPLIWPGILAGSVLTFMAAFGSFSIPLITGGNYRPLSVSIYTQISSFMPARWSMASTMAIVMAVLQVTFLSIYMRVLRRPTL